MSDYTIGYGKPPLNTRWKKGQCGNPKRKRPVEMPSIADMIDDEFGRTFSAIENGASRRRTTFEIILLRLLPEIARGNKKAIRIRKKYQTYAQGHPTIVNVVKVEHTPEEVDAAYRAILAPTETVTKEQIEFHEAFRQLTPIEAAEIYRETLNFINNED